MLQAGLKTAKGTDVGPERHEREIALVAEDGCRHDLALVFLGGLDGGLHRLAIDPLAGGAEEVEDADASFHAHGCRLLSKSRRPREPLWCVHVAAVVADESGQAEVGTSCGVDRERGRARSPRRPCRSRRPTPSAPSRRLRDHSRTGRARSPAASSASSIAPTTLSTALCRPTSSRTSPTSPVASNTAAACTAPVASNRICRSATSVGHASQEVERHRARVGQCRQAIAQLVDLLATAPATARRRRTEPWCRRRSATTGIDGDHVELGLHGASVGAVPDTGDGQAGQQALGVAETDGELEVVAGCAHGDRDDRVVELDGHRFLDDQIVGPATGAVGRH